MTKILSFWITLCISLCISEFGYGQTIQLNNVNFFTDGQFKIFPIAYVFNGKFTFKKPSSIDTIVNLDNKFVIPPLAEGHTHKLDSQSELDKDIQTFLKQGVFYALVLNNLSSNSTSNKTKLNVPKTLDVAYANGGITASGQHPSFVYERILSGIKEWWLPDNTEKIKNSRKGENDAYWFMDSPEDVIKKWDIYIKTNPDIVKVYLMNVQNNFSQNPKSLSEKTIREIVKKAKKSGLRVVAHIESFEDLKIALKSGISIFGHMPHYNVNYLKELPKELIFTNKELKVIAKLKPVIIPTLSFNEEFSIVRNAKNNYQGELDTAIFNRSLKFQKETIKKLKDVGFSFAIGSDRDYLLPELLYWFKYQIFSNNEIITIATKNTPRLIFPNRHLSELKEGYEASFVVLNQNPLENSNSIKDISLKVKNGQVVE